MTKHESSRLRLSQQAERLQLKQRAVRCAWDPCHAMRRKFHLPFRLPLQTMVGGALEDVWMAGNKAYRAAAAVGGAMEEAAVQTVQRAWGSAQQLPGGGGSSFGTPGSGGDHDAGALPPRLAAPAAAAAAAVPGNPQKAGAQRAAPGGPVLQTPGRQHVNMLEPRAVVWLLLAVALFVTGVVLVSVGANKFYNSSVASFAT